MGQKKELHLISGFWTWSTGSLCSNDICVSRYRHFSSATSVNSWRQEVGGDASNARGSA